MKYLLFVGGDETMDLGPEGEAQMQAGAEAWVREMDGRGVRLQGDRLGLSTEATTVRVRNDELLIADGPFAETKEQIGGFDLLECADLDEAIEVASKHPVAKVGFIEVRAFWQGSRTEAEAAVAAAFREEWGRVVATLIRVAGDWDVAEECTQDAFEQALRSWARDGVPERPGAWLTTVARNRALDRLRRGAVEATKLELIGADPTVDADDEPLEEDEIPDDRLRLIFTCCHPALAFDARVALTLRSLAGLTTSEIARAFLVPEQTMAKRLVRAKQKIRNAGIPYRVPPPDLLPSRTAGVLAVLYLLFNEGYAASMGADLVRQNLCDDAIRLARALVRAHARGARGCGAARAAAAFSRRGGTRGSTGAVSS